MNLSDKNIVVFGPGVSGRATLEFLGHFDISSATIVGSGDPSEWKLDDSFLEAPFQALSQTDPRCEDIFADSDLIILSPGIAREHPLLTKALNKGVKVWCEVELAYHFFKGPIIGVTGTNGKTTTVTLLGEVFKRYGSSPFIGGNIGLPFVKSYKAQTPYDLAVLELSSFQLESLEDFHCQFSAILNVFPNHGERYENHEDYRLAKWNIISHQSHSPSVEQNDILFLGAGVGDMPEGLGSPEVVSMPENFEVDLVQEIEGFDFSQVKIVGLHNRMNIWFAWKLFSSYIERYERENLSKAKKIFKEVVYEFKGVEHRVEATGQWDGHLLYNDAKSTNWKATLTALTAVEELNLPIYLIMGGQLRGQNDLPSDEQLEQIKNSAAHILTIGESGELLSKNFPLFQYVKDLAGVKEKMLELKEKGVLLFSPGFPSFDQFNNYAHRGRCFKEVFGTEK